MSKAETTIETYINRPLATGQIRPKIRGACRHLVGEYDPTLHAWCDGVWMIITGENTYPRI
jgi:hypothetical protein